VGALYQKSEVEGPVTVVVGKEERVWSIKNGKRKRVCVVNFDNEKSQTCAKSAECHE
jgi:hypothetical protein